MEKKRKKIDKWINGTENSPEIDIRIYGQLIFDKGAQAFQRRKNSLFNN